MPATANNPLDSTELVVETKINIDELIKLMSAEDLPMISGVNSDGLPAIPREPVDNIQFYWLEEDVPSPSTTLLTALADGTGTAVVVAAGTGVRFSVGDAFRIENEVMAISAITNDTFTVVRGVAGTSGAAHATLKPIKGLGTFLDEGEIGTQNFLGRDKYSNYTQILTSQISMTRTAQKLPKYGVPSELAKQTANLMFSEGVNLENIFLYGVKYLLGLKRMTGGLAYYITTNVDNTVPWLSVGNIEDRQQIAYDNGGQFDTLVAQPGAFQALNNIAGNERVQTVEITDPRRGRVRARVVITEYGEVMLHRNRHVLPTHAFGINREDCIHRVFQPMIMQPLAKTKDMDSWMFVYEGGFEIKGERHMARWTALDTNAVFPADLT